MAAYAVAATALALLQGLSAAEATAEAGKARDQPSRFLVRFMDYEDATDLAARTLGRVAAPHTGRGGKFSVECSDETCRGANGTACRAVHRENAAAAFPTDFCVLEV